MHMNLSIRNIILLFTVISWTMAAAQDCKSRISVLTNNPQSVIILNNKAVGNGSIVLELEKGKYSLVVREDNLAWNSQIFKDSLIVSECNTSKEVHFNFRDEVYLNTSPVNAGVFHNDSLIGYTPLYINSANSEIEIIKENYKTQRITLNGEKYSVINLEFIGQKNESSFFRTNLFKILLGSAVALGGTAAYFKLKADDEYEKYNLTKDAAYLDKTDQYDLISGISFGALQVNFGLLIYYFLTD